MMTLGIDMTRNSWPCHLVPDTSRSLPRASRAKRDDWEAGVCRVRSSPLLQPFERPPLVVVSERRVRWLGIIDGGVPSPAITVVKQGL